MTVYKISQQLDQLIRAIYEGPLEDKPWWTFLNLFRTAVAGNYATLVLRPPREGDSGLVLNAVVVSPEVYDSYNSTYFSLDPFVDLPADTVVTLQEFMPREDLLETEYYQQYMAPIDVFHNMGVDMSGPEGLNARLRVTRPESADDFSDAEKALCKLILPHLQQSIALHSRIKRTESEREFYAGAIDQLAMGIIILDENTHILRTNKVADKLLASHPGLLIKDGQLQVGGRSENRNFRALVEQVFSAHRHSEPGFVKAFRVGQVDSLTGLGLLIRPLPIVDSSAAQKNPSVAIFIGDQEQRRVAPNAVLGELFGFTPAESSLALLLSNGLTLDEASNELGVTRNTAKSHLSSVFSKTGLTRQTKLVQLILKSVASFGG
jgi:DNA-binding CsgD family transcriptional regulator/PAS domain-containing protein